MPLFPVDLRRVLNRLVACSLVLTFGASSPVFAQGATASPAAPARFAIMEFVVRGNTVLPVDVIERAVYPFLGETQTIDDVEAARKALENAYRERGFGTVGVDIPEQRADGGVIELLVIEGVVSRLRITGSRYFSQGYILEKVPSAAEGSVPQFSKLQAELGTVNRTADRRVTPALRPGRTPGTTEVDLQVEDSLPLHGTLELNNRASPNTSATRLQGSLRYDNLWQRDHSLSLQLQLSPEKTDEVQLWTTSYTLPAGDVGQNALTLSYTRSDSKVVAGVGATKVFGKGNLYALRYNAVLDLGEARYHAVTLGADYKDLLETIDAGDSTGFATPIQYMPLSANYLGTLNDAQGRWQFGAGLVAGMNGLFSRDAQFADKRYLARAGFSVLKFSLGRDQKLPVGLSVSGKVELQLTAQPLISNEQLVVGGVDSVRGYLESAAAGDKGLRAGFELRSPELARRQTAWLSSVKAHAFVEGATLQLISPLPGQTWRFRLLGTGFGLRVKGPTWASLSLDMAWPLLPLGETERGKPRLHASGSFEF